jgi:hypothetical protein
MDSCLSSAITFGSRINTIQARILAIAFDLRDKKVRLVCIDPRKGNHSKGDPNLSIVTKVTLADLAMLIVPGLGELTAGSVVIIVSRNSLPERIGAM